MKRWLGNTQRDSKMPRKNRRPLIAAVMLLVLVSAACGGVSSAQAPQVLLKSKSLRMTVLLPSSTDGWYRGDRFDWSGVISNLEFNGHHIYQPWFGGVDPSIPDFVYKDDRIIVGSNTAMTGPAEEFKNAIGYDVVGPGGLFLKVGVGMLRRTDQTPYHFTKSYEIADGGKWEVESNKQAVTMTHTLGGADKPYGYIYVKTIKLLKNSAAFVIEHELTNTGRSPIETPVYDHNLFNVDNRDVSAGNSISTAYIIDRASVKKNSSITINQNKVLYTSNLENQDRISIPLAGFGNSATEYDFTAYDKPSGVKVHIAGDRPLAKVMLWSLRSVMCVEPFIDLRADPGETVKWTVTYTLSEEKSGK